MADPVTLGLTATAIGSVVSAGGSIFSGLAGSAAAKYQAAIAQMNAKIAQQNASYELAIGETRAQQQGMKTRAQIGQTRATQGASGLDVNAGTNVTVRASEAELGAEDQAMIRSNAAFRAYGQEVVAAQETAQGQLDLMAARTSQTAGEIGAFSSILGGVGSFSDKWLKGTQAGLL